MYSISHITSTYKVHYLNLRRRKTPQEVSGRLLTQTLSYSYSGVSRTTLIGKRSYTLPESIDVFYLLL